MSICPLLSKSLLDATNLISNGSGSHSKGNYTIEKIGLYIAIIWMDCITTNCQWWDSVHSNCSVPTNNLYNYHRHDSHDHVDAHATATIPADPGAAIVPPASQSKASLLSQEYMSGEDTDSNSLIFGVDFGLDITDTDVPKMLMTILNSPDFPVGLTTYTWIEYLATLP
jgi:hypothetical protein